MKTPRPAFIAARSAQLRKMAVTRMESVDPAVIDRKILPHLEVRLQVRPHRPIVYVVLRDHEVESRDVAQELQGPQERIAGEDRHDVVKMSDVVGARDESLLPRG